MTHALAHGTVQQLAGLPLLDDNHITREDDPVCDLARNSTSWVTIIVKFGLCQAANELKRSLIVAACKKE